MFTYFPTVCPANNANGSANQTQPPVSLPGCVLTGQTLCCGSNQAQGQTYFPSIGHCAAQAQSPISLPGCVQTGQTAFCGNDQPQGQTYFPSIGHCAAQAQSPVSLPGCVKTGQTACCGNDQPQGQTYFPSIGHCAAQAQSPVSLPGCVQTGQTVCCGNDQPQGQTYFPSIGHCAAQAQSPVSLPGCVQTGQTVCCGNDQPQGQTYFPSIGHCAAQAQFPTLSMQCLSATTKILTQVAGCGGQAQAQTYFPSIGSCAAAQAPTITIPQDCGVSWNCNQATAPAQAQFPTLSMQCLSATTKILTQVAGCGGQAQAQTYFPSIGSCAAAQTLPITIPQDCGVSWNCNQGTAPAQAQFPTLSMQCLQVTTGVLTQLAGCSGQAQAQTYFPSIGSCAAAQTPPVTNPQDCGVSWNCKPPVQAQTYFPSLGSC